jgi:hypothetical protein
VNNVKMKNGDTRGKCEYQRQDGKECVFVRVVKEVKECVVLMHPKAVQERATIPRLATLPGEKLAPENKKSP